MSRNIVLLLVIFTVIVVIEAAEWNHNETDLEHGPSHWYRDYPQCKGDRQSPIHINSSTTHYASDLGEFEYDGYDTAGSKLKLKNTGHGTQVDIVDNKPQISGGGLGATYTLQQFHFHSGRNHTKGSEHLLDFGKYGSEIHFVHTHDELPNLDAMKASPTGLAVLGVLIKAEGKVDHPGYAKIIKYLQDVINEGDEIEIPSFAMDELLPLDHHHYYRYYGSLTTPPCSEAVVWTVFRNYVTLSDNQIEAFRKLKNEDEQLLLDTHRPTQPINNRKVYRSFEYVPRPSPPIYAGAIGGHNANVISILLVVLIFSYFL